MIPTFILNGEKKIIKLSQKYTFYFKTITQLRSATNDEDLFGAFSFKSVTKNTEIFCNTESKANINERFLLHIIPGLVKSLYGTRIVSAQMNVI